jgi:NAD(P)-dependent dehydrogenase (short-subunit alcohol dehydrogenase family)
MTEQKRVWFITGISGGFGKCLAEEVIQSGDLVVGTFRKAEQVEYFNQLHAGKALAVQMDVTKPSQVQEAVDKAIETFGRIDVVVNNAGYGLMGAVEEVSLTEARDLFKTNVFGVMNVLQAVLPHLRKQKSGHILQMSSVSGFKASSGFGLYNASKFALEGLSEALAAEMIPFNVKVTLVEPGPFRTAFAGSSLKRAEKKIDAYDPTPTGEWMKQFPERDGKQDGDPVKAAKLMIEVVNSANPPLRIPMGQIAYDGIKRKIENVQKDMETWKEKLVKTSY